MAQLGQRFVAFSGVPGCLGNRKMGLGNLRIGLGKVAHQFQYRAPVALPRQHLVEMEEASGAAFAFAGNDFFKVGTRFAQAAAVEEQCRGSLGGLGRIRLQRLP